MVSIELSPGRERRVLSGHPWIFSNEIANIRGERAPGAAAEIFAASGKFLGTGYYNPHSLIAARLLSRSRIDIDSVAFYQERLHQALALRQSLYPDLATFRLVHGEGDFLPGLVVDKYGDYLSLQFLSYGMDARRDLIVAALAELLSPAGIVARNDVGVRSLEGLDDRVEVLWGDIPDRIEIEEHGLSFQVSLLSGQKTGHFLDQKENHLLLKGIVAGKEVLDCFCYSGSWGVHAAAFGAAQVTCLDISERAIGLARENGARNNVAGLMEFQTVDVFERLRSLHGEGRLFDVIVLDPPAFVKSKKALKEAEKGYLTINRRAMELLRPGGFLITCSCSFHMGRELFTDLLRSAAIQARREFRLRSVHSQAPDHSVLLAVPETEYLKCCVLQAV